MFLAVGTAILVCLTVIDFSLRSTKANPSDTNQNQNDAKSLHVCPRPRLCAHGRFIHPATLLPLRLLRDWESVYAGQDLLPISRSAGRGLTTLLCCSQ